MRCTSCRQKITETVGSGKEKTWICACGAEYQMLRGRAKRVT